MLSALIGGNARSEIRESQAIGSQRKPLAFGRQFSIPSAFSQRLANFLVALAIFVATNSDATNFKAQAVTLF